MGTAAVIITILSILGGKYTAVELSICDEIGGEAEAVESAVAELQNDEYVVSFLADEIVADRDARGESVEWPSGVDPADAAAQADYPPAIWADAVSRWEQMSDQDQATYRDQVAERVRQNIQQAFAEISTEVF